LVWTFTGLAYYYTVPVFFILLHADALFPQAWKNWLKAYIPGYTPTPLENLPIAAAIAGVTVLFGLLGMPAWVVWAVFVGGHWEINAILKRSIFQTPFNIHHPLIYRVLAMLFFLLLAPTKIGLGIGLLMVGMVKNSNHLAENNLEPETLPDALEIRSGAKAHGYKFGDFAGVDIDHYIYAQKQLADKQLSQAQMTAMVVLLNKTPGFAPNQTMDNFYEWIHSALIEHGYTPEILDLINGDAYSDPRLLETVVTKQNKNPHVQGILEAGSNGGDALGLTLGKFGMGVKQNLVWLEDPGDEIVVTTQAEGQVMRQERILKGPNGQLYIQLKPSQERITTSTRVQIKVQRQIRKNMLDRISQAIQDRFAFVTRIKYFVENQGQRIELNGHSGKRLLAGTPQPIIPGGQVTIQLAAHEICISDNGSGMNASQLSRMFVPGYGSKAPDPNAENSGSLERVQVIEDTNQPSGLYLARNSEVIRVIRFPQSIAADGLLPHGLMIDLPDRLWEVGKARDDLKLTSSTIIGIMRAVEGLLANQKKTCLAGAQQQSDFATLEKLLVINTLVTGLDELSSGNPEYQELVKSMRGKIKEGIAPQVAELKRAGYIFLPQEQEYDDILFLVESEKSGSPVA
jgi:hypothetical protein